MSHPNEEGLFEVYGRCCATDELLNNVFGVDRIAKIESGSFLYEACCRVLLNDHTFRNYRQIIKESKVNSMKHYSSSDISNMIKNGCYELVLNDIGNALVIKNSMFGSRAIDHNLSKSIRCKVNQFFEVRKKDSINLLHIYMTILKMIYYPQ